MRLRGSTSLVNRWGIRTQLQQQIEQLKEKVEALQKEATRLKTLVQQLEKQHRGYDTVH